MFAGFKFFLSSVAEAFFMSVPVLAILGAGIFKFRLNEIPKKQIVIGVINILVLLGVTVAMFYHLEKMMFGKIIWREVFLAGYFLLAVGTFILSLKALARFIAKLLTRQIKNIFLQSIIGHLNFLSCGKLERITRGTISYSLIQL